MTADQIRKLREDLGLSIRGFADKIGVDKNTVVHWEKNRHNPKGLTLKALERLAKRAAKK